MDKDGKSQCLGKDTNITFLNSTFKTEDEISTIDTGFIAINDNLTIANSILSEIILCAPHQYFHVDLATDQIFCSVNSYIPSKKVPKTQAVEALWSTGDTRHINHGHQNWQILAQAQSLATVLLLTR